MLMADFKTAFRKTDQAEGKYSNHPQDPGGETYRGISRRAHPDWPGWAIIDKTSVYTYDSNQELQQLVEELYEREYWDALLLDFSHSQRVANEIYDTAVNMGLRRATKFLQVALDALGYTIKIDSRLGTITMGLLNKALSDDYRNEEVILRLMDSQQGVHYILQRKPVFIKGWALKRLRNE